MSLASIICCCASSEVHADWASGIAITNEAAFFDAIDLTCKELAAVREAVAKEDWTAAKVAWGKYLEKYILPRWIWSYRDLDKIEAYLKKRGAWDGKLDAAQSKPSCDTLAQTWMVTHDPKYAEEWARLLSDWIVDCPVTSEDSKGPWHRLETPHRVKAWFSAMNKMVGAAAFDTELRYQMSRSLVEHARVLHRNPRLAGSLNLNNIHSGMANGLAMLAIILPEAKESGDWWKLARAKVGEHMKKGVYPDGAYHEVTPLYHYWVTDQFLTVMLLARKNRVEAPELFERHEKMYEFMMHISKPDRGWQPIGDADDGKAKIPVAMTTAALLYGRRDMRYLGPDDVPLGRYSELVWQFPPEKLESYPTMPAVKPAFQSHMMPYAQFGVMRTGWETKDRWLLFDCGPDGGPHTHCDRLQVLLYSGGRDLLLDLGPGPGYHEPDRPYYISHEAHNVVLINGKGVARDANPEVVTWSVKDGAEFTAGKEKNSGFMQQRSVLFVKPNYWVVVDHVSGKAKEAPTFKRLFHLPLGKVVQDVNSVRTTFEEGNNIWLHTADGTPAAVQYDDLPTGKKRDNPTAVFEGKASLPAALCTVLVPFSDEKEIPTVERLKSGDEETVVLRVQFGDGRTDWIAVAPTERELKAGKRSGKGMALCVRTDKDGKEAAFELFGVTPLRRAAGK